MANFTYEALNAAGKPQKGTIEAANSEEAIQRIKGQGSIRSPSSSATMASLC